MGEAARGVCEEVCRAIRNKAANAFDEHADAPVADEAEQLSGRLGAGEGVGSGPRAPGVLDARGEREASVMSISMWLMTDRGWPDGLTILTTRKYGNFAP